MDAGSFDQWAGRSFEGLVVRGTAGWKIRCVHACQFYQRVHRRQIISWNENNSNTVPSTGSAGVVSGHELE